MKTEKSIRGDHTKSVLKGKWRGGEEGLRLQGKKRQNYGDVVETNNFKLRRVSRTMEEVLQKTLDGLD